MKKICYIAITCIIFFSIIATMALGTMNNKTVELTPSLKIKSAASDIVWSDYFDSYTFGQYLDGTIDDCGCNYGKIVGFYEKLFPMPFLIDVSIISDLSEINNKLPSYVDFYNEDFPDYFNWKDHEGKDWTTPAKNQLVPRRCGSCGVFSAFGSLESVIKIREGCADMNPDLSEQYVLSCLPAAAKEFGKGCITGVLPSNAYKYIMSTREEGNFHNGIIWESCFPYQARDLSQGVTCDQKCSDWLDYLVPISDYGSVLNWGVRDNTPESIEIIKNLVMQNGPTMAGMDYVNQIHIWGVIHHSPEDYYPDKDEGYGGRLTHGIVIVGWKDDSLIDNGGYWICKNSAGEKWGYDGFFNVEYGALFTGALLEWADYDPESFDWPPNTPAISGLASVKPEEEYEYTFTSMDPDGDDNVFYYIDWGDGSISGWIGPYESYEEVSVKHTWQNKATYNIRAKAKDLSGLESDWGTLTVTVLKNKPIIDRSVLNFIQQHPNLFPILKKLLKL